MMREEERGEKYLPVPSPPSFTPLSSP